jgi:hypothetical protein
LVFSIYLEPISSKELERETKVFKDYKNWKSWTSTEYRCYPLAYIVVLYYRLRVRVVTALLTNSPGVLPILTYPLVRLLTGKSIGGGKSISGISIAIRNIRNSYLILKDYYYYSRSTRKAFRRISGIARRYIRKYRVSLIEDIYFLDNKSLLENDRDILEAFRVFMTYFGTGGNEEIRLDYEGNDITLPIKIEGIEK